MKKIIKSLTILSICALFVFINQPQDIKANTELAIYNEVKLNENTDRLTHIWSTISVLGLIAIIVYYKKSPNTEE